MTQLSSAGPHCAGCSLLLRVSCFHSAIRSANTSRAMNSSPDAPGEGATVGAWERGAFPAFSPDRLGILITTGDIDIWGY